MEFKGTKGKWNITRSSDRLISLLNGEIEVWGYSCNDRNIMEANARLISKAPEMLEMLLKIRNKQPINTKQLDELIKEATTI